MIAWTVADWMIVSAWTGGPANRAPQTWHTTCADNNYNFYMRRGCSAFDLAHQCRAISTRKRRDLCACVRVQWCFVNYRSVAVIIIVARSAQRRTLARTRTLAGRWCFCLFSGLSRYTAFLALQLYMVYAWRWLEVGSCDVRCVNSATNWKCEFSFVWKISQCFYICMF